MQPIIALKLCNLAKEGKSWEETQEAHLALLEEDLMSNQKMGGHDVIKCVESGRTTSETKMGSAQLLLATPSKDALCVHIKRDCLNS